MRRVYGGGVTLIRVGPNPYRMHADQLEVRMWIFTRHGFVSAVHKYGGIQVRSRDRISLDSVSKLCGVEIRRSPDADYPYRISTDTETFAAWLFEEAKAVNYANFKSEVQTVRGLNFVRPLHKVWDLMHDVEDSDAREPR